MKGLFLWERPLVPWVIKVPFQGRQGEDLPVKMPGSCLSHAHSGGAKRNFCLPLSRQAWKWTESLLSSVDSEQATKPNIWSCSWRSFCQFHQNWDQNRDLDSFLPQAQVSPDLCTGLSKRNGAKLRESFCPAAANHSRPRQAGASRRALTILGRKRNWRRNPSS